MEKEETTVQTPGSTTSTAVCEGDQAEISYELTPIPSGSLAIQYEYFSQGNLTRSTTNHSQTLPTYIKRTETYASHHTSHSTLAETPVDVGTVGNAESKQDKLDRVETSGSVGPPPDGGYGWFVVLSAFLVNFYIFGQTLSFGVFQDAYLKDVFAGQVSTLQVAFIGTLANSLMVGLGVFIAPWIARFGYRPIMAAGSIISPLGLILASINTSYWQLYLTQGVMFGVGGALTFNPSIGLPAQYFDKYRGVATGMSVCGSGIGGLTLSPLTQYLITHYGYRATLRYLGIMGFGILGISTLLAKPRLRLVFRGSPFKIIDTSLLTKQMGIILFFGSTICWGYLVPFFLLPTYAQSIGVSANTASVLVGVMSGINACSRIVLGYMADTFGRVNTMFTCTAIACISIFILWTFAHSLPVLIVFVIIYGTSGGGFISLYPVVTADVVGLAKLGTALGMVYSTNASGALFGTPVAGAILDAGGYIPCIMFAGVMTFIATLSMLWLKLIRGKGKFFCQRFRFRMGNTTSHAKEPRDIEVPGVFEGPIEPFPESRMPDPINKPLSASPPSPQSSPQAQDNAVSDLQKPVLDTVPHFKWEEGRRFHNDQASSYVLPNDHMEVDRLQNQHLLLKWAMEGNFRAPVHDMLVRGANVLDIGCGPGTWLLEMAETYPNSNFYGIDISAILPAKIPPNVYFTRANAAHRLPYPDNHFDYVFQRLLCAAFRDSEWQRVMREVNRVCGHEGWVELVEIDLTPRHAGPLFTKTMEKVNGVLLRRGLNPFAGKSLPHYIAMVNHPPPEPETLEDGTVSLPLTAPSNITPSLCDLDGESDTSSPVNTTDQPVISYVSIPFSWGGRIGDMASRDLRAVMNGLAALEVASSPPTARMSSAASITSVASTASNQTRLEQFTAELDATLEECAGYKSYMDLYSAVVQLCKSQA
ncbi:hypothetical protein BZG36_04280 [Bifiguratus adelaidae]|uniref:Major facilitator superfamily (MFS) profile domain-containing protein n=1 Tax=Bifiguratus adelaidae TaxID=1938954 RepID=A0A261XW75_9FUNG|nr:hypothetical protein BZG36_04280 [Bifiguratus adelaidae]